eukprot:2559439-Prymnesium_polylepis.1
MRPAAMLGPALLPCVGLRGVLGHSLGGTLSGDKRKLRWIASEREARNRNCALRETAKSRMLCHPWRVDPAACLALIEWDSAQRRPSVSPEAREHFHVYPVPGMEGHDGLCIAANLPLGVQLLEMRHGTQDGELWWMTREGVHICIRTQLLVRLAADVECHRRVCSIEASGTQLQLLARGLIDRER